MSYLLSEWKQMFNPLTMSKDIWAGITVALVAFPLNLALAIAAGVPPGVGITTGIIAGVVGGLFGGQKIGITGPAAAMAVVLVEIAENYGLNAIWLVCIIAGVLQLLAGGLRLGRLISFLPRPVMVGFSSAIGILVICNALDDFLGLPTKAPVHPGQLPFADSRFIPDFIVDMTHIWHRCFVHNEMNGYAILIGVIALTIAILTPKVTKVLPGQLVAILVATGLTKILHFQIPLIKDIATIPNMLPAPMIPDLPWNDVVALFPVAVTVFMLGSLESLLSASVADTMTRERHRPNQELIGQGMANLIVPFFGGIPVTGVIARTSINIRAGAQTRLAAIVHSVALCGLMFFLAGFAKEIPLAALAAILIRTGNGLIERKTIRSMWKASRTESFVAFATAVASVSIDLTAGVFTGLACACALFIARMSDLKEPQNSSDYDTMNENELPTCKFVKTYIVDGPLFFGAAEKLFEQLAIGDDIKAVILQMRMMRVIDLTGVETLVSIHRLLAKQHARLVLVEVPNQPLQMLERTDVLAYIGEENIFSNYRAAVIDVNSRLLSEQCMSCEHRDVRTNIPKNSAKDASKNPPKDCRLRAGLIDAGNPLSRLIQSHRSKAQDFPDKAGFEWLFAVDKPELVPANLRGTPLEVLLLGQNTGLLDEPVSAEPQLVIGMCIDFRKSLIIPRDWSYIIRREGANMEDSEFAIALAISKGVRYMALIAHNDCAMARTEQSRDSFVEALTGIGWKRKRAIEFFDEHARSREIGNEIDFVLHESERIETMFPGLTVVPMLFRVDDDKLYLIYDWLVKHAPRESLMAKLELRNTGQFERALVACQDGASIR